MLYTFISAVILFMIFQLYIYICISSSCRAANTDLFDPLSPPVSIVHRSQEAISCIGTELLYIGSSWSSCLCLSMWRDPREYMLMCSTLHLQKWPACLVRLTLIVYVMGGRWPYSCCFVGCCLQDLFNTARSILKRSFFPSIYIWIEHSM